MPCTTILVGKKASNDNSTMIARTDDGHFDVKKMIVVKPKDQPRKYKSVLSHVEIELPDNPMRYTACPNVDKKEGIWGTTGINEANVGMSATETISSNPRVLSADPLVVYKKKKGKNGKEKKGGIGEEDIITLVLPYIHSAREGVLRLAELLEKYGTYESNGVAFNDENEVWWLETIGGHHWMARRVKDNECVINPNQFGMDSFDMEDACTHQRENMCSNDLKEFIEKYNLNLRKDKVFNPRDIFGSHEDADHVYNTPRAWFMARYLMPSRKWEGENPDFTPESDDIPWSFEPEKKVTIEDVKYLLSSYYQGTEYNPYSQNKSDKRGIYRTIGINRTGVMGICQIRSDVVEAAKGIEWVCFGSTSFNAMIPIYTNVDKLPKYISRVSLDSTTENFYWASRYIGALTDPYFYSSIQHIERYQEIMATEGRRLLLEYDKKAGEDIKLLEEANEKLCKMAKEKTTEVLNHVLQVACENMKNGFHRSDH